MTNLLGIDRNIGVDRKVYILMCLTFVVVSDLILDICPTEGFDCEEAVRVLKKRTNQFRK